MTARSEARGSAESRGWLNRSTLGVALASFFSDVSHEMATAVLPAVLLALGAGPAALGLIEGSADGISAIAKLWGGVTADRVTRRKPLAAVGYLVTAVGISAIALCTSWTQVMACRIAAWAGRGVRGPARDVLMAESAAPAALGKAFGMERASDALGAVLGPLLAVWLLHRGVEASRLVLWALVPGVLAVLSIALIVVERPRGSAPAARQSALGHLAATGRPFRRYLVAVLAFGCGDFSRTLLILYATQHAVGTLFSLSAASLAVALYVLHNAVSALASFPVGALSDRVGRRPVLVGGYLLAAVTTVAFALLPSTPLVLVVLFMLSGIYIACEEVAEKAYGMALLPEGVKGAGMGLLAATNGIGDFVSSALVGTLWALFPGRPAIGFLAAGTLQLVGAAALATRRGVPPSQRDAQGA